MEFGSLITGGVGSYCVGELGDCIGLQQFSGISNFTNYFAGEVYGLINPEKGGLVKQ